MDAFVLRAVLGLDKSEYDEGLNQAGKQASTFSQVLKANLITKGVEVAVKGMAKLGNAAVSMVKQSVDAFADYEQLTGGVETLFKGSADKVKKYADEAYKTAGLSANQYMETVTSFSASLLQSLGGNTSKAADLANQAIIDMSDNANKMGTDMQAIQNAYQGFAKQNYTMLDNLKLGYGGTKSEMDRLIMDAAKLDKTFKYNTKTVKKNKKTVQELDYTYADIVRAIHIVQTNMGITGTTAKEAASTVSGSLGMLKSSWQNLLTGMGQSNKQNLAKLINDVVDSAETVANNLIPVIENAIDGFATLIERLSPILQDKLPVWLDRLMPPLVKGVGTLLKAAGNAIVQNAPTIVNAAIDVLKAVYEEIKKQYPWAIPLLGGAVGLKVAGGVAKGYGVLKTLGIAGGAGAAGKAVGAAAGAGGGAAAGGAAAGGAAASGAAGSALAVGGLAVVGSAAALGITGAVFDKKYQRESREAREAETKNISKMLENYKKLVETKGKAVADEWAKMVYGIDVSQKNIAASERAIAAKIDSEMYVMPQNAWAGFLAGWNDYFGENGKGFGALLHDAFVRPAKNAWKLLTSELTKIITGIRDILTRIGDGISNAATSTWNYVTGIWNKAVDWGKNLINNFISGIKTAWNSVVAFIKSIPDAVSGFFSGLVRSALNWGRDLIGNFISGINSMWNGLKQKVGSVAQLIRDFIGFSEPKEGPLSNFHTYAPDMMKLFAQGIDDNKRLVSDAMNRSFNYTPAANGQALPAGVETVMPRNPQATMQPLNLILDDTVIGRVLLPYIRAEQQRVGVKLSAGGAF